MYHIYMDSGTSNTRAFLVKGGKALDSVSTKVGTKDSAISGSNDVLLGAMRDCYDKLLERNSVSAGNIAGIWASGMVTNAFGVVEVGHCSTPIDAAKLADTVYRHKEHKYFHRELRLIRGAKTAQPGQVVDMDNLAGMNNVRGEEIEAVGMVASGVLPQSGDCVMISPGSHTHMLRIKDGAIVDIASSFTGELNHAIRAQTILGGELSGGPVKMTEEYVLKGLAYLREYGVTRALYIIHASRVFGTGSDEIRSQLLEGIIAGSVILLLADKLKGDWRGVERVLIIDGKSYVKAYELLAKSLLQGVAITLQDSPPGESFALRGFLEILKRSGQ